MYLNRLATGNGCWDPNSQLRSLADFSTTKSSPALQQLAGQSRMQAIAKCIHSWQSTQTNPQCVWTPPLKIRDDLNFGRHAENILLDPLRSSHQGREHQTVSCSCDWQTQHAGRLLHRHGLDARFIATTQMKGASRERGDRKMSHLFPNLLLQMSGALRKGNTGRR